MSGREREGVGMRGSMTGQRSERYQERGQIWTQALTLLALGPAAGHGTRRALRVEDSSCSDGASLFMFQAPLSLETHAEAPVYSPTEGPQFIAINAKYPSPLKDNIS